MHHPTDRIAHTTAFVTPVVEHWLEREIVHKERKKERKKETRKKQERNKERNKQRKKEKERLSLNMRTSLFNFNLRLMKKIPSTHYNFSPNLLKINF